MKIRVRLAKLSICQCGFPLLDESIKLGTEYEVDQAKQAKKFIVICGGCHRQNLADSVWVEARGTSRGGWLSVGVFESIDHTEVLPGVVISVVE
jgi:hypothetical protein